MFTYLALALLLFFHIVGALVFIPAFVSLLKPRFVKRRSATEGPVAVPAEIQADEGSMD